MKRTFKLPNYVQVDPDKIKTLDDVIEIIRFLGIGADINEDRTEMIKHLLKDKENKI